MRLLSISKCLLIASTAFNFSYANENEKDIRNQSEIIFDSTLNVLKSFPNTTYVDTRSFLEKKFHRFPGVLNHLHLNNIIEAKKKEKNDIFNIILDKSKIETLPVIQDKDKLPEKRLKAHRILEYLGIKNKYGKALLKLADIYFYGYYGYEQNIDKAFQLYQFLADEMGNPQAQQKIGFIYSIGLGSIKRDQAKALLYLSFAAMNNDISSQMAIGYRYLFGISTERNCDEAVWYYRKIADEMVKIQQSGPPLGRLLPSPKISAYEEDGGIFGKGASNVIGRPIDEAKGGADISETELHQLYKYIEENEKHNPNKQVLIALNYYQGTPPIKKNFKKALKIFKVAARHLPEEIYKSDNIEITEKDLEFIPTNNKIKAAAKAAAFVGQMYWRGEGVEPNEVEARKWYQRSAKLGYSAAINALGVMYQYGYGQLKQDEDLAIKYFIASSNKGNPDAQTNLGSILAESDIVENKISAFNLFQQASKTGNIVASYKLASFYMAGEIVAEQCVFAASLYKTIAERASYYDELFEEAKMDLRRRNYDAALLKYIILSEQGYEIAQSNAAYLIDEGLASINSLFYNEQNPYSIALVYWKRSANQMNPDARVKVGDYYFYGLGTDEFMEEEVTESDDSSSDDDNDDDNDDEDNKLENQEGEESTTTEKKDDKKHEAGTTEMDESTRHEIKNSMLRFSQKIAGSLYGKQGTPDYSIAFSYYQAAADNEKSSLAMWNLAFMYEYGIGVKKDLFLAKRYYDRSLEINPFASTPIKLALYKLNLKVQIHNIKCQLTHREDEMINFKEDKEGTDNKINFDDGDDETSKGINERIKQSFKDKHGQNEKELTLSEKLLKSMEIDKETKLILTSFLFKFLLGYGVGYIIYAIFHYRQHRRFPTVRFSLVVLYLFLFSACIGTMLSNIQEELQRRLQLPHH
ncbi:HCP-like protein [Piromyces finnis]|uniref:HCP-like protein n=1 Tax=Piromyces finnis TaxID=1754191 RepID=A0A1Y1V2F7_9FUNG|nr:HCP-like protein [Piromyces finnis]|eukprot:ORX45589.1 HCP-like protein [Piromyces finnis]